MLLRIDSAAVSQLKAVSIAQSNNGLVNTEENLKKIQSLRRNNEGDDFDDNEDIENKEYKEYKEDNEDNEDNENNEQYTESIMELLGKKKHRSFKRTSTIDNKNIVIYSL